MGIFSLAKLRIEEALHCLKKMAEAANSEQKDGSSVQADNDWMPSFELKDEISE